MNRILPARRLDALMLAVACATLAACGGSDGPPPPPPPPPPAATAPTITAQPAATVTVAEGASAALAVSAESNAGALSYEWRSGSPPVAIAGAASSAYATPPASLVDHGKVFSVAVSNSAGTTASGNSVLSVTERSWAAPAVPRSSQAAGDLPTGTTSLAVAIDSQGGSWMAFSELRPNGARVLRFSYTPAGQTSPQVTHGLGAAELPDNVSVHDVKLVPSDNGYMLAVWREGLLDSGGGTIQAGLLQPGASGWSTFGAISGGSDAASPAAAYVGNGVFEIVWRQQASSELTAYDILARRVVFGDTNPNGALPAGSELVEAESANALAPQIASDGAGNVLIGFTTNADDERSFANARPAAHGAWTPAGAIQFAGIYPVALAHLTMNAQGRAVALMRGSAHRVYMRQYQFAGNESGWMGEVQYVANYNQNLTPAVEPVAVFGAGNDFSIVSVHDLGRGVSRWPCTDSGCGAAQSILVTSQLDAFTDLRAGRDAAGNLIVLFGQDQGNSLGVAAGAVRWHAGLAEWRPLAYAGTLGSTRVDGPLQLAVHPDGRALAMFPIANDGLAFARAWMFR